MDFPLTQVTISTPIRLVVISICNGIAIPLLALLSTIQALKQLGWNISIIYTLIVEKSKSANDIAFKLLQAHGYPQPVQVLELLEDLNNWVLEHFNNRSILPIRDTYVCVLSGTPCKSISYGCKASHFRKDFGLHANPSNLWFLAHEAITSICLFYKPCWRIILVENVVPPNTTDLKELDETAGYRSTMETILEQGSKRNRFAWTSIKLLYNHQFPKELENLIFDPISTAWAFQTNRPFPTLRAIFPALFWRNIDGNISHSDKQTVSDCFILHVATTSPTLPPLRVWGQLMGFDACTINAIYNTIPLCVGSITIWPADNSPSRSERCGSVAFCQNCSDKLAHMGEAWNLKATRSKLFNLFQNFLKQSLNDDIEVQIALDEQSYQYKHPAHKCTVQCPLIRKTLL